MGWRGLAVRSLNEQAKAASIFSQREIHQFNEQASLKLSDKAWKAWERGAFESEQYPLLKELLSDPQLAVHPLPYLKFDPSMGFEVLPSLLIIPDQQATHPLAKQAYEAWRDWGMQTVLADSYLTVWGLYYSNSHAALLKFLPNHIETIFRHELRHAMLAKARRQGYRTGLGFSIHFLKEHSNFSLEEIYTAGSDAHSRILREEEKALYDFSLFPYHEEILRAGELLKGLSVSYSGSR